MFLRLLLILFIGSFALEPTKDGRTISLFCEHGVQRLFSVFLEGFLENSPQTWCAFIYSESKREDGYNFGSSLSVFNRKHLQQEVFNLARLGGWFSKEYLIDEFRNLSSTNLSDSDLTTLKRSICLNYIINERGEFIDENMNEVMIRCHEEGIIW
jgi:hypothetical protein